MQPIFVTGATGFLGAHLVCALLKKGYVVKALKRPISNLNEFNFISGLYFGQDPNSVVKNLTWVDGDITDYDTFEEHINSETIVFHCAALVSFHQADKERLFKTNLKGTENVVNACLANGCKKLVYSSSTAAVGNAENGHITDEHTEWDEKDKPSNYSVSKYYAELEVWRGVEEGLNAVIVNPPLIIGPCNWTKTTGQFFVNASKGFPFYTMGSSAFVYVNDVADTMLKLAESNLQAERYLLVGANASWKDFLCMVAEAVGKKKPSIEVKPWMTGLAWRWFGFLEFITGKKGIITKESAASGFNKVSYSSEKIKKALGVKFTPLQTAISETAAAFKKNPKI